MAQSTEGKLLIQVRDALNRMDFNVHAFANGTTNYTPVTKVRLAELVSAIGDVYRIDRSYGQFGAVDHEAVKYLAGLRKYTTGLDTPFDDC